MSTHSSIGVKTPNGKVMFVNCHWDGYIDYVGRILFEHYRNLDKAIDLMMDGDIVSLKSTLDATEHWKDEDWDLPKVASGVEEWRRIGDGEYFYLFNRGKWRVIYSELVSKEDGGIEVKEVNTILKKEMFEKAA